MNEAISPCCAAIALTVYFKVRILSAVCRRFHSEIDFMLAQGYLVMAHLNFQPHTEQSVHQLVRTRTASSTAEKSK